jgi:hypothetical protein
MPTVNSPFRLQRAGVNLPAPGLYNQPDSIAPGLYPVGARPRQALGLFGVKSPNQLPLGGTEQTPEDPTAGAIAVEPTAPPRTVSASVPANFSPSSGGVSLAPDERTDVPLPLGNAVASPVAGLFESVHTKPLLNDPAGGSDAPLPTPSKYTLTQTTRPASSSTPGGIDVNADAIALASLFNPSIQDNASASRGTRNGSRAALDVSDAFGELGPAGSVLQGAAGLERTRLGLAAQDIMRREAPNVPQATDTPEVRANKLAYMTKRVTKSAAAAGLPGSTTDLARTAMEISQRAGQPRLVTLGTDASGRSVEGTVDRNGNFSPIKPKDETAGGTQLAKLVKERDEFAKAGRTDIVAQYDSAIKNYGAKYDAFGNPIGGTPTATPTAAVPAAAAPAAPTASTPSNQNQQALAWANAHPQDPRSAQIKTRLGVK